MQLQVPRLQRRHALNVPDARLDALKRLGQLHCHGLLLLRRQLGERLHRHLRVLLVGATHRQSVAVRHLHAAGAGANTGARTGASTGYTVGSPFFIVQGVRLHGVVRRHGQQAQRRRRVSRRRRRLRKTGVPAGDGIGSRHGGRRGASDRRSRSGSNVSSRTCRRAGAALLLAV